MKKKIFGIFACSLLIGTIVPTLSVNNLSINTSTQPAVDRENSDLFFNLNSKNWSYIRSDIQIQTLRNISKPSKVILSSYKSPLHELRNFESANITTICENSSNQVFVIKLSSAHEIKILNYTAEFNLSIINKQETEYSHMYGIYILDAFEKIYDYSCLSWITGPGFKNLRYFKLNSFIYDNRAVFEHIGWVSKGRFKIPNLSLPPGDWILIFYAGLYDVPNLNTHIHTTVIFNIIDMPDDLHITKNENGTFYGLWYGEFNPVFAVTKGWVFDVMFKGKTQFFVNNTFFFRFDGHPISDGYWSISWETPLGVKHCEIKVKDTIYTSYNNEEDVQWCIFGNGGSGSYLLTTHYIDRGNIKCWAIPIYLSAIDVPLR